MMHAPCPLRRVAMLKYRHSSGSNEVAMEIEMGAGNPRTPAAGHRGDRLEQGQWLNAPAEHAFDASGALHLLTGANTDFWRETHYGFTRDSGHFLGIRTPSAFTCQFRIRGTYEALYDQAGLMVRVDAQHWVKAGIEVSDGHAMLSSVRTDGCSDWATAPYGDDPADFWMRATVSNAVLRLQVSRDGRQWPLVRLCPLPAASHYWAGPMACSPERGGLRVSFSDWTLGPASLKDLHDLT